MRERVSSRRRGMNDGAGQGTGSGAAPAGSARAPVPGSKPETRLIPQGPFLRGAAFVVDLVLLLLITAPMALVTAGSSASARSLTLVFLAVGFLYFVIAESVFGTTVGKRCFGLRVVRASDGAPCGFVAALVRTILRPVDHLLFCLPGLIAMSSSRTHQRFGDRAARTMVVMELPERFLRIIESATTPVAGTAPWKASAVTAPAVARPGSAPAAADDPGFSGQPPVHESCPFCAAPVRLDEIVCPSCEHYVNQVTAYGDTQDMAPAPLLYAEDRGWRFDALWRLVFAGDEESLAGVRTAVAGWPCDERLLAVQTFAEVDDPRPLPFLSAMTHDADATVRALAHNVRSRLTSRDPGGRTPG